MEIVRKIYLEKIRGYYDSNLIKVLTGVRRCGKSVLLKQIKLEIVSLLNVSESHIIEVNFEDASFSKLTTFTKLNTYILKRIKDNKKYYIFLDEIQHVRQFERVLASLKATQNVSIFVTGSNSKLLFGRLATLLVGRCKEFKIFPFSFSEYLEYYSLNKMQISEDPIQDFIRFGGMPQRFDYNSEDEIKEYLKSIFNDIVNKDICNKKSKINKESFYAVAKYVLSNIGKEFSASNIVESYNKQNDEKIYRETVYRYLEKMEDACLISRVNRYDIASKRNLKSIEKQYAIDSGFVLSALNSIQTPVTHILENVIFNELIFRGYNVLIGKTYKGEIDFVVIKNGKKCFIQVAYILADDYVIQREFGAFDSVRDSSPKYVFSLDKFDMSRNGITHFNIIDWLTHKKDINLS